MKVLRRKENWCFLLPALLLSACGQSSPGDGKSAEPARAKPLTGEAVKPAPVAALPTPKTYFGDLGRPLITRPVAYTPGSGRSVLLIVVDALNVRHLDAYGYARKTAPNIRAAADRGVMFTNHISNSSWTRPSITTIMTGLTKKQHGVELNGQHLKNEVSTVAERFRFAGYRTAGFVGNPLVRKIWGYGQGFQLYRDTGFFKRVFPWDKLLADEALAWLKKDEKTPFYLMVFFTGPHAPYRPPERFREFSISVKKGPVIDYPFKEYLNPLPKEDQDRIVAAYDDEIAYTDSQIGRLFSYLKETSRLDDTIVVITADHGELLGEHNCYGHTWHMWEPALRVPLIIDAPGLEQAAGMIDDRPLSHPDIAPTLFHLAGLAHRDPRHMGVSIVERLENPSRGRIRNLFSQYNAHGVRRQAVRKGPLKLIHHNLVPKSALKHLDDLNPGYPAAAPDMLPSLALDTERFELYDLAADPKEEHDLFEEKKGTKELAELMDTLSSMVTTPTKPVPTLSDETLEALRNAGYIQ